MTSSLEGIRILDLTRFFAGPHCTMLLADLGAEVIKVEEPKVGDGQRNIGPFTHGQAYSFVMMNRNKKSITLNLKSEKGKNIFEKLVIKADVVVENFTPGVMARLRLGYRELRRVNPQIIYAAVSGFGQTGPYRSHVAYDMIAQAMSGIMSITGQPNDPPTKTGPAMADLIGSLYAAVAVLAALQYREKTGKGQAIDISMHDCMWSIGCFEFLPHYLLTGQVPKRLGNRHPNVTPYNSYTAKDGYVVINTTTDAQWEALIRAMGRKELRGDPRFSTLEKRVEKVDEVDALVEGWTNKREVKEVIDKLREAHVPCAPVLSLDKAADDPHLHSRQMLLEMCHPVAGKIKVPGNVFKLSETPGEIRFPAPLLGQHNEDVYGSILECSKEEIDGLAKEGVI